MTWVPNRWYVAAWDSEVDRAPIARTICGKPVVLYRKLDRTVVALRDACPHRLLPLSMGFKEGDSIRCRYHGLLVGPDGAAQEMPIKSERVPKVICAQVYRVVERHRFVWVWIGDPERADEALVPDFWPCSAAGWTFDGGYNHIACDYRLVIDNLMDLSHETYVHQGSIGQHEILDSPIETKVDNDQVFVSRWMAGIDPPPFWRDALRSSGAVDRWQICQFVAPSSVLIDVGVAPVEANASFESHDSGVRGFVIDAMTPETERTTHYFWGMARNFDINDAGFTARFKAQQGQVFDEDVEVLEAQQKAIDMNPDLRLRGFSIDEGSARARQIITRLSSAEGAVAG
ncbi:MAG: aromatic ring-hydroxylating dioxygenase subunit alpha [Sphingomicrobium sp.]